MMSAFMNGGGVLEFATFYAPLGFRLLGYLGQICNDSDGWNGESSHYTWLCIGQLLASRYIDCPEDTIGNQNKEN